jgi:DNA-binding NarL/FixJ family response regulator
MGLGQSNREIAKSLSVSEDTVEKHVSNILQKLELTSRAMLITFIHSNHLNALIRMPHGERFLLMLVN